MQGYCEKEALAGAAEAEATEVTLDPCLSDVLFKGLLKRGDPWPTTLPKTQLTAALVKRLAPHHVVLRGNEQVWALSLPRAPPLYCPPGGEASESMPFCLTA